jgi:hypothetical protein
MWRFEIPYTGVRHSKHLLWIWFLLFLRVAFLRARLISSGTCWNIPGPSWPSLRVFVPLFFHIPSNNLTIGFWHCPANRTYFF